MCGIFGFSGEPKPEVLISMGQSIFHRGPDEGGYWNDGKSISLGMRRLSIIDLNGGQQPISNEDGTIQVVFNGEIYNYIELRQDLIQKGHVFKTDHSDTEVLVHLYETYGPDYLNHLNGMFAIAIWDSNKQELHLARDYAGIKPLYFSVQNKQIYFGSEIKSFFKHPALTPRPNYPALYHYFSFKNIPAPDSAFEGIEQLRPGERLVFKNGEGKRHRWWNIRSQADSQMDEKDAAQKLRSLLEDSVNLQMRCDVPFGAYLSGGVDSSSVVALMTKISNRPVRAFTLAYADGFAYKNADLECAKKIAAKYGCEHYVHYMTSQEILDSFDKVVHSFDEPFSGVTSTYYITQLIAKHVKVCLSGDGADELFGSYRAHRLAAENYFSENTEVDQRMALYLWDDNQKQQLLSPKMLDLARGVQTKNIVSDVLKSVSDKNSLNRMLRVDFSILLPDQVLAFVDRLSMAHSVEVRPPFLDHRIIEFAFSIPGSLKIKNGRVKNILKEAVKDLLPAELLDRPKEGFVLPVNDWLLSNLSGYMKEILSPKRLEKHGLLNPEFVNNLIQTPEAVKENGARIWNLMMFQLWWEKWFP